MDVDGNWTEKLISSVENKPLLYNKALKEYSNRDLKEKAWMEVCENVIPDWEQLTEDIKRIKSREIQQRWANLRSCFAREMREQKKGTSGQAAQKRRKYVYFDQLLFLLPTVEERETESNLEPPESCLDQEDSLVPSEPPAVEQTPRPPPSTGRPKKKTTSYEQSLLDILKEKSDKREEIDEDKTFALSLVPALKRLSFEKKFEAKMEIMGVLHRLSRAPPAPTQHNVNVPLYQAYATLTAPGASYDGGNVSYHQRCRTPYAQTSGTPSPSSSFQSVSNLNEQSPTSEFY